MNVLSQQVNNVESGGVVKGYELNINYLINNLTINVNGEVSFGVDIPNLLIPQNELLPSRLKLRDEISNILKSALKKDEEWQPLILGRIPKFYHSFLNRKDELRQLVQAIVCSQKGIILITGIGGIGKTWFVTEALHQITSSTFDNTSSNFLQFDNIFFVRCDEQTISLESVSSQ